jgi:hypothetical protein
MKTKEQKAKERNLQDLKFRAYCKAVGIPDPNAEVQFHSTRRWRFDYAWPQYRVALEIEGGVFTGGRHTSGAGFVKDAEKYNYAACMGWAIIRCMPRTLCTGDTMAFIKQAIQVQIPKVSNNPKPEELP